MSSSKTPAPAPVFTPVSDFHYRQMIALPSAPAVPLDERVESEGDGQGAELLRKEIQAEYFAAIADTEQRLRNEHAEELKLQKERIGTAILQFEQQRKEYFSGVEREVVQLSLAIAAKILHRESQVDPLLISALVRVAIEQLKEGALACIRVRPEEVKAWNDAFSAELVKGTVQVVSDVSLSPKDCMLETPLGSVNLSLDVQLKEVERGYLDILAQRPGI